MTRANFEIICGYPKKHCFEKGSDGYLSGVMGDIFKFILSCAHIDGGNLEFYESPAAWDLAAFIKECNLTLGHVGNFCYAYEIDFKKKTVKAWNSNTRWVNAPENWEERGWSCYKNEKGKWGYTTWVKGKMLINIKFKEMIRIEQDIKGLAPAINKPVLEIYEQD